MSIVPHRRARQRADSRQIVHMDSAVMASPLPRLEVLNVNTGQQHARRYRCSCPKQMRRARARAPV
eukprot:scaffold42590_cov34-Phaeocystis_antarctica.AAC.2